MLQRLGTLASAPRPDDRAIHAAGSARRTRGAEPASRSRDASLVKPGARAAVIGPTPTPRAGFTACRRDPGRTAHHGPVNAYVICSPCGSNGHTGAHASRELAAGI